MCYVKHDLPITSNPGPQKFNLFQRWNVCGVCVCGSWGVCLCVYVCECVSRARATVVGLNDDRMGYKDGRVLPIAYPRV